MQIKIENKVVEAVIDTGAGLSITKKVEGLPLFPSSIRMQAVGGYSLAVVGTQRLRVTVGGITIIHSLFVVEGVSETILGIDILRRLNARIDLKNKLLHTSGDSLPLNSRIGERSVNRVEEAKVPECPVQSIRSCLTKFAHLFTDANDEYGFCNWMEHKIQLVGGQQCKLVFRRIPEKLLPEVQKQVTEMERKGIIQRSNSPYCSPVLLTKKADGTYRFCIDFRELNRVTVKDAFPMPQMEEIFAKLHSARLISLIDLRSGYWQLPIAEKDRQKTAFCVNGQQYEFLRMPFGLCNFPATFRRLLLRILDDLTGVVVYGDDIVVFSENEAEHVSRLEAVLQRLDQAGLKLSQKKSQIAQKSIVCLGHIVENGEVRPLPEKLETIRNFASPKSKRQLRSFLGVIAYDSKFIPRFSEKISPLLKLLRKEEPFVWTSEAEAAFNHLKECITREAKFLKIPKPHEKFTVAVDASNYGIGAVLTQPSGVIEYASRVLTSAEQKYSTTEKECLAIVWALEKWRTYLLASEFHVITDHKPLSWLMTAKDPRGRLARWAYRLQEFTFTIGHIDGTKNEVPDMLSRPLQEDILPETAIPICLITTRDKRLLEDQKKDELVTAVRNHLQAGTKPASTSPEIKELLNVWNSLRIDDGILTFENEQTGERLPFVPQDRRRRVIQLIHDGSHMGFERVFEILRKRVFWPMLRRDVAAYIKECPNCQTSRESEAPRPPMQSIEVDDSLQAWGLDIFGPLPVSRDGNRYILVMIDLFSRWVEAIPTKNQTGETVAKEFESNVISRFGVPQYVITHRGPCFESRVFNDTLDRWGVQRRRTSSYHPQTNGLTERFNRTMKEWINSTKVGWEQALREVLFAYRTSIQDIPIQVTFF